MTVDPTGRHPSDGKPFYCAVCGCGFDEYLACEMPDCELETLEQANKRRGHMPDCKWPVLECRCAKQAEADKFDAHYPEF